MFSCYASMCIDCNRAIIYTQAERHRGRRTRVRPTSRPSTRREGLARCKTFTFTTSIFIRVYCTLSAVIRVPAAHTLAVREFKQTKIKKRKVLCSTVSLSKQIAQCSQPRRVRPELGLQSHAGRDLVCTARYWRCILHFTTGDEELLAVVRMIFKDAYIFFTIIDFNNNASLSVQLAVTDYR